MSEFDRNRLHLITDPASQLAHQLDTTLSALSTDETPARKRPIKLIPHKRTVKVGHRELELSRREYDVLEFLFNRVGTVIDRDDIIDYLWKGVASDSNV